MADIIYGIGTEFGGTFTDVACLITVTGVLDSAKMPTDYSDCVEAKSQTVFGLAHIPGQAAE